jgi:hypothetical protein
MAGTRGRALFDGQPALRLHGMMPVRAAIVRIPPLSAHADHSELSRGLKRRQR